jgi:hypothetical protein
MAMQDSQSVATNETSALISSDKVEGTAVYDRQGEKLGSIHSVMIDKVSGKVAYAVMSFGGFLGMGDRYHPLPWHVLDYDTSQGGYVVDLDRAGSKGRRLTARARRRTGAIAAGASRFTTTTARAPTGSRRSVTRVGCCAARLLLCYT